MNKKLNDLEMIGLPAPKKQEGGWIVPAMIATSLAAPLIQKLFGGTIPRKQLTGRVYEKDGVAYIPIGKDRMLVGTLKNGRLEISSKSKSGKPKIIKAHFDKKGEIQPAKKKESTIMNKLVGEYIAENKPYEKMTKAEMQQLFKEAVASAKDAIIKHDEEVEIPDFTDEDFAKAEGKKEKELDDFSDIAGLYGEGVKRKSKAKPKRQPSAYNMFIKENMPKLKDSGLTHKDKMRALAEKWQSMK